VVHGRGCNPHCSLWRRWWRHNSETIRERKTETASPMKSSELSNGENRIALRQLLQNRKLCNSWLHNLGSRWKLQKMARENFSIGAFYNITKNQDNPIKTVGRDSFCFWARKPLKYKFLGVAQPLYSRGHNWTQAYNICPSLIEIGSKTAEKDSAQTDRQTNQQTLQK